MPHHTFYLLSVAGQYYRTADKNKGKRSNGEPRAPKKPRACVVAPSYATHYPTTALAKTAIFGILQARGNSYDQLKDALGRKPTYHDFTIEEFRALPPYKRRKKKDG